MFFVSQKLMRGFMEDQHNLFGVKSASFSSCLEIQRNQSS